MIAIRFPPQQKRETGECHMIVDGQNILVGPCDYVVDKDGVALFAIDGSEIPQKFRGVVAQIAKEKGKAYARMILATEPGVVTSEVDAVTKILGEVHPIGACWMNKRASICVCSKETREQCRGYPAECHITIDDLDVMIGQCDIKRDQFSNGFGIAFRSNQSSEIPSSANAVTVNVAKADETIVAGIIVMTETGALHRENLGQVTPLNAC